MGPWAGWIGGWAITMTGVLVLGSLAEVGVRFTLLALGLDGWAESTPVVMVLTVALILLMAWICVRGTEVSARLQNGLILAQTRGPGRLRRRGAHPWRPRRQPLRALARPGTGWTRSAPAGRH